MPFVRNRTEEWLYWSDTLACTAGVVAEGGQEDCDDDYCEADRIRGHENYGLGWFEAESSNVVQHLFYDVCQWPVLINDKGFVRLRFLKNRKLAVQQPLVKKVFRS